MSELSKKQFVLSIPESAKRDWRKVHTPPADLRQIIAKFCVDPGAAVQFTRDCKVYNVYEACLYAVGYADEGDGSDTVLTGYDRGFTLVICKWFGYPLKSISSRVKVQCV